MNFPSVPLKSRYDVNGSMEAFQAFRVGSIPIICIKMFEVEYKVSIRPSKHLAYQSKAQNKGIVKTYINNIWDICNDDFCEFVCTLDFIILLERVCLERGFQKIRMKDRCKQYKDFNCKMEWVACNLY